MISVRAARTAGAADTPQDYLINVIPWELKKAMCGCVEVQFMQRLSVLIMRKDGLLGCTEAI